MTKTLTKTLALLLMAGLPSIAVAQNSLDANADGMISLDEVQAMFPEVDSDTFMQADSDGDALLNADEIAAAQQAGLIPATDG